MLGSELTSSSGKTSTSPTPHPVPLYKLKAVSLVSTDGVCESVLYGDPLIVKPTACWKLDWEELESNQQQFMALCQQLAKQVRTLLLLKQTLNTIHRDKHFLLVPRIKLIYHRLAPLLFPWDTFSFFLLPHRHPSSSSQC